MAHFVRLDNDGYVIDGIVIDDSDAPDPAPSNSEPLGQAFIASLAANEPRLAGTWVQTSYNGSFRGIYAGLGSRYDAVADVFIPPAPFPSWVWSGSEWEAPTPKPADTDTGAYVWDEDALAWVFVEFPPAPVPE